MDDFYYSYDKESNQFNVWASDALICESKDYEPMTEKEAYNLAEQFFIEFIQSK
jgi:hypothetical protein